MYFIISSTAAQAKKMKKRKASPVVMHQLVFRRSVGKRRVERFGWNGGVEHTQFVIIVAVPGCRTVRPSVVLIEPASIFLPGAGLVWLDAFMRNAVVLPCLGSFAIPARLPEQ